MTTNKNYQICSAAIADYQSQNFQTLQEACREYKADYQLAVIMLNNEKALEQEMVDSDMFESRMLNCSACDKNINNICNECACPVSFILMSVKLRDLQSPRCKRNIFSNTHGHK